MDISQDLKVKLESMQIKGIRRMIWDNIDREHIESRLLQIKNQSHTDNLEKLLNCQSRSTLIHLIEMSPEITNAIIDETYEQYRYGLKPGFTLFWAKGHMGEGLTKESLEKYIVAYTKELTYEDEAKYKKLEYVALVQFDGVYELTFSYLQRLNYIDSAGEFTFVYTMKECFVWIGIGRDFIAINNMPDALMNPLKNFFSRIYHADITNVRLTNGLLKKVFSNNNAKRITRQSSNPPENQLEKLIVADSNLSEKADCIPAGYESYDITSTQYVEEIDESTTGTLGVNCNKGKLYLSKSLTSTQFRAWSIKRITDIIDFFKNTTEVTLESIKGFNMFSSSEWDGVAKSAIPLLEQIALGIISCKKSGNTVFPIAFDLHDASHELGKYFRCRVACLCDTCEERAIPSCLKCGSTALQHVSRGAARILCTNCGDSQIGTYAFSCENGHTISFDTINKVIELISNDEFTKKLKQTIGIYYPGYTLADCDYIVLNENGLEICMSPDYEKLKPSDISEFFEIASRTPKNPIEELDEKLYAMKEKCSCPTKEKCMDCKNKSPHSFESASCILQLFSRFEGFTPQPHHGHEFGDVSFLVNHQGRNMTFLGVAKSVTAKNHMKITKSSDVGREIIQQVVDALNDARTEIVGVIYPYILDDQLKYLLYHQAKLANKRFVILDHDFMVKLLDSYIDLPEKDV